MMKNITNITNSTIIPVNIPDTISSFKFLLPPGSFDVGKTVGTKVEAEVGVKGTVEVRAILEDVSV